MYKCGICGKDHAKLDDYVACVEKCGRQVKVEQQRQREEELARQKTERFENIYKKYNELRDEIKAFAKDYGYSPISFRYSFADLINELCR